MTSRQALPCSDSPRRRSASSPLLQPPPATLSKATTTPRMTLTIRALWCNHPCFPRRSTLRGLRTKCTASRSMQAPTSPFSTDSWPTMGTSFPNHPPGCPDTPLKAQWLSWVSRRTRPKTRSPRPRLVWEGSSCAALSKRHWNDTEPPRRPRTSPPNTETSAVVRCSIRAAPTLMQHTPPSQDQDRHPSPANGP